MPSKQFCKGLYALRYAFDWFQSNADVLLHSLESFIGAYVVEKNCQRYPAAFWIPVSENQEEDRDLPMVINVPSNIGCSERFTVFAHNRWYWGFKTVSIWSDLFSKKCYVA